MPEKKLTQSVVSQPASIKKESTFEKFLRSFTTIDSKNIKEYILFDVVVPSIKRGISTTVNMILYGNANAPSNGGGYYYTGNYPKPTAYTGLYTTRSNNLQPIQSNAFKSINGTGFQNLAFANRADAEAVLQSLQEAISQFGIVSAGEMYDMAKVPTDNYTLNNVGWTNLNGVGIMRDGGGYVIDLPRPAPLKNI